MQEFMLLIQKSPKKDISPEEIQQRVEAYRAWVLEKGDQILDGQPLQDTGVLLRDPSTVMTDGPFTESKEIIAGYVLIRAEDLDCAIELARSCPLLKDFSIQLRPLSPRLTGPDS